jgi:hypothetical protein
MKKLLSWITGAPVEKIAEYFTQRQQLKHEIKLETLRGKIAWEEAKTRRASESEGRDAEWELESIRNSGWKDEWVLILLSIPLVLVFIPQTQPVVVEGFAALEATPEWYRWLVMLIFTAIYGIRLWRRKFT